MFKSRKKESDDYLKYQGIENVVLESEKILKASQDNNLEVWLSNRNLSPELTQIADNLNKAFKNYNSAVGYDLMKYKLANSASDLGLWDMDIVSGDPSNPDNSCTWSKEFKGMLGFFNEADFSNRLGSWIERLHPDDKKRTLDRFSKYITEASGRNSYSADYRLKLKDGTYKYFHMTGQVMCDSTGTPIRMAGLLRDIHDEKMKSEAPPKPTGYDAINSELKILKSGSEADKPLSLKGNIHNLPDEAKETMGLFNSILENIQELSKLQAVKLNLINSTKRIGLFVMNLVNGDPTNPGSEFLWSDEFRYLLGFKDEREFPNGLNTWASRLHPDDFGPTMTEFTKYLSDVNYVIFELEYRVLKKNNEYGTYSAYGSTIRDEKGMALTIVGALQDISEQKKNKIELDTLDMRLNLLQKSINIALWDMKVNLADPMSQDNSIWWSPEFRQLLGYRSESDFPNLLGSWINILHPEDKEKTLAAFSSHIMDKTGRTPCTVEYRAKNRDGEYIWLKMDASTLREDDGTPISTVGSAEDISNSLRTSHLEEHIEKFSKEIDGMTHSIAEILESTADISNAQKENLEAAIRSEKNASETKSIVASIKSIAMETSILGINASIEAARSGEAGRGFKVVSEEIAKLSEQSKKSAEQIDIKLKTIQDSGKDITEHIKGTSTLIENQTTTMEQVKIMVDEINSMYNELIDLIKE